MKKSEIANQLKREQLSLDIQALEYDLKYLQYEDVFYKEQVKTYNDMALALYRTINKMFGDVYALNFKFDEQTLRLLAKWADLRNKVNDNKKAA